MKITDNKPNSILLNENYMKAAPLYSRMRYGCPLSLVLFDTLFKALGNKTREEAAEKPVGKKMSKFT